MSEFKQEDFFTADAANAGRRVFLLDRFGKVSKAWVEVMGCDSDAFQLAKVAESRRKVEAVVSLRAQAAEAKTAEEEVRQQEDLAEIRGQRRITASLVKSWSFDGPCIVDTVDAFLARSPQNIARIDAFVFNRALFFAPEPNSSSSTENPNSGSTPSPETPSKQSGPA